MNTKRFGLGAIAAAMVLAGGCATGEADGGAGAADLPTLQTGAFDGGDAAGDDATGESGGANDGDGPDGEIDPDVAMADYEQCMADQGFDVGFGEEVEGAAVERFEIDDEDADGAVAIGDLDDFEAAAEQCDQILDDAFGDFELTPEEEAEFADQMLELQRCLSDQGFDIDMTGNGFDIGEDIDFDAFDEAMRTCESESQLDWVEVGP